MNTDISIPTKKSKTLWWFLWRLLWTAVCVLLLLLVVLYTAMGTRTGTVFILDKITEQTGVQLNYGDGDLRNGLWVSDIAIIANDDISVHINRAYIKMGWRAIFSKQIHLSAANIDSVVIDDKKAPTGEPFDYPSIALPMILVLEQSRINEISYRKKDTSPIRLHDIDIKKATWQDSDIRLEKSNISIDNEVVVSDVSGKIRLDGDYPLSAQAMVQIKTLNQHYFGDFDVSASGTLKRTTGVLTTKYHQDTLTGEFLVQGMDDDVPFWAKVNFDSVRLPYAKDQNIVLSDGTLVAMGVLSDIELRANTLLSGKDIPKGRYFGRMAVDKNGMDIKQLYANVQAGDVSATGRLDWANDFVMNVAISSDNLDVQKAMPKDYADYHAYAPKVLNGTLAFDFGLKDDKDNTWYRFDLKQQDGEQVNVHLRQKNSPLDDNPNAWHIDAVWQGLYRQNLPNLGELNSPSGQASLVLGDDITVNANAHIVKLSQLPQGDYHAQAVIAGHDVKIIQATYQGVAGDLTADGTVYLATDNRPLSWHINGVTHELKPNDYLGSIGNPSRVPVQALVGRFLTTGRLRRDGNDDVLELTLDNADLTANLDNHRQASLVGKSQAVLRLNDGVQHFRLDVDGQLKTQGINQGLADNELHLVATGNLQDIDISQLTLSGKAGRVSLSGDVSLADGVAWQAHIHADKLNTQAFHQQAFAVLTGDVYSTGLYKNSQLVAMQTVVEADVLSQRNHVPSGRLLADVVGSQYKYTVNRLDYQGEAGDLSAQGWVDFKDGVVADLTANMQKLNLEHFIKNRPSDLTGDVSLSLDWQDDEQAIDIRTLNVQGHINDERVKMRGKALARLNLPKDLSAYIADIKKDAKAKFDLDKLTGGFQTSFGHGLSQLGFEANQLQHDLAKENRQFRHIIKALAVDDLTAVFGDNQLKLNGNEQKLTLNVNAPMISQIFPTVRGGIVGGMIVQSGDKGLPTLYLDLKLNNLSMPSFAMREASVVGRVVDLAYKDSALVVEGSNVVVLGESLRRVRMDLFGTQGNHDIRLSASNNELQMGLRLQGGLQGEHYQGVLSEGRLQTRMGVLNQNQPAELIYQLDKGQIKMAAHCWQTLSAHGQMTDSSLGSLCLKDTLALSADSGRLDLSVKNLDTAVFTPLLPSDLSWRSRLNGKIDARWGKDNPDVEVVLYSDNGVIGLRSEGLPDTTLPYDRISVIAKSVASGLKVRTDIQGGEKGDGYVDVVINPYQTPKPIKGVLALTNFNLGVLRPFFPAMQTLGGLLNVTGDVGGTLSRPLIDGKANLTQGRLSLVDVPLSLSDIELAMDVRGTKANVSGEFMAGSGKGELKGELDWQKELQAKLSLVGDELVISSPPLLSAKVSPDLQITARPAQKYVNVEGVVSVPSAVIRPPEGTHSVVEQSGDVTVIDRRATGNIDDILAAVVPWSINANIGLDLGDDVVFRGFGAKLPLAGALHLTQSGQGRLQGRGVIQVSERTMVDAIGQNLELNYAQIRFNGSVMNPRLSIEAVRQIEGKTVGVRVSDHLDKPNIQVFNDAGLSEQQAMNALVTGSLSEFGGIQVSEQNLRSQVTNSLAAAGLSLGLRGTRGLTNQLGHALGLQSLTVDASGLTADTRINVTGQITPDLYIRYGVGVFGADATLSARYQLTRRVYVEATTGVERMVDLVYRWRLK